MINVTKPCRMVIIAHDATVYNLWDALEATQKYLKSHPDPSSVLVDRDAQWGWWSISLFYTGDEEL